MSTPNRISSIIDYRASDHTHYFSREYFSSFLYFIRKYEDFYTEILIFFFQQNCFQDRENI